MNTCQTINTPLPSPFQMSSDKSIVMKAFLNQFTDFVEDVHSVFPDNADIDSAKTALFLIKKTNPRILMHAWITYIVGPYTDKIEKGDIGFFLEKDYTQDLEYMGTARPSSRDGRRQPSQVHEVHSKFDKAGEAAR